MRDTHPDVSKQWTFRMFAGERVEQGTTQCQTPNLIQNRSVTNDHKTKGRFVPLCHHLLILRQRILLPVQEPDIWWLTHEPGLCVSAIVVSCRRRNSHLFYHLWSVTDSVEQKRQQMLPDVRDTRMQWPVTSLPATVCPTCRRSCDPLTDLQSPGRMNSPGKQSHCSSCCGLVNSVLWKMD